MDILQLRYFLIASKSNSFTTAAKTAYTSRQNLTRSIHQLENEFGTQLFSRQGNDIKLTYTGVQVAAKVENILKEIDELSELLNADKERRTINLAVAMNTTSLFPALSIKNFSEFPIEVSEHRALTCCDQIISGNADIAFIACMERDFPNCSHVLIAKEPFVFLCAQGSKIASKKSIDMRDLGGHDIVLFPNSDFIYEHFLDAFRRFEVPNSRIREIASIPLMKNELKQHDAVAIVNTTFARYTPDGFATCRYENPHMQWCLYALYRNTPEMADVKPIIEKAKAVIAADRQDSTTT